MEKEPITVSGLNNLKTELEDLKNVQRPKVVEAIAEARSHGDLKENAEYHAAKEQQALIESRVIAINDIIARANVIDVTKIENNGKVIFGSTVKLQDLENDKQINYKLVGQDEADIKKNLIFFKSPIGKALVGKDKGEMVTVNTPSGEKNFEILDVEYIYEFCLIISLTLSSEILKLFSIHSSSIFLNTLPNKTPSLIPLFIKYFPSISNLCFLDFKIFFIVSEKFLKLFFEFEIKFKILRFIKWFLSLE